MRRRRFQCLAGVFTAFTALVIVLWWRSYDGGDFFGWQFESEAAADPWIRSLGFWSGLGGMGFGFTESHYPPGTPIKLLLSHDPSIRDGSFRWERENGRDHPYYPFDHSNRFKLLDRIGFDGIRFKMAIPPPWKTDGSQLRAWQMNTVTIPDWIVVSLAVILPIAWLIAEGLRLLRAEELRRSTLCRSCGYDVRATPDRCPECGSSPARD